MNKLLIMTITVVICFSILVCDSQSKSQYNKATNQRIFFQGISFQVPKDWKKEIIDKENIIFSEDSKGKSPIHVLIISFNQDTNLDKNMDYLKQDKHIKVLNESDTSIANMSAKKIKFIQKINNQQYNLEGIALEARRGIIRILFYSSSKMGQEDFNKVVESITQE